MKEGKEGIEGREGNEGRRECRKKGQTDGRKEKNRKVWKEGRKERTERKGEEERKGMTSTRPANSSGKIIRGNCRRRNREMAVNAVAASMDLPSSTV